MLRRFHTYDEGDEVMEFLTRYPAVIPALRVAQDAVFVHFASKPVISLVVVTDPDDHEPPVLNLDVMTDLATDAAIDRALERLTSLSIFWRTNEGTRLIAFDVRDTSRVELG
jgi:hypothetical protein